MHDTTAPFTLAPDRTPFLDLEKRQPKRATVKLVEDEDCGNPLTDCDGQWTLYDFTRRGAGDSPKDAGFLVGDHGWTPSIGLRRKFTVGLAFFLDLYDHSGQSWSLSGEGMNDRWDTSHKAGLLVWKNKPSDMGAKTKDARKEDARRTLETYNQWLNGDCWGYILTDSDTGQEIDSCWGFISQDYCREQAENNAKAMGYILA